MNKLDLLTVQDEFPKVLNKCSILIHKFHPAYSSSDRSQRGLPHRSGATGQEPFFPIAPIGAALQASKPC
jgi:hypothetical protein